MAKSSLSEEILTVEGPHMVEGKLPGDPQEVTHGSYEESPCREASCLDPQKVPPPPTHTLPD